MSPPEIDAARRVLGAIAGGVLAGTIAHEAAHACAARLVGARWGVERWEPPRLWYALDADAPRWREYVIKLAPQALAWPAIVLALWAGWPPLDRAHVLHWSLLVAAGAGGSPDYELVAEDARNWLSEWDRTERVLAVALAGSAVAAVGAGAENALLFLWGGIVGTGVLVGVLLGEETRHPEETVK